MLDSIINGRTDLVFDWVEGGAGAAATDGSGVPLIRWCAYYGDVSAVKYLLANGAGLDLLGPNFDLNGAAFHGHWQLCEFFLGEGADPNHALPDTLETPLHAAFTKRPCVRRERVAQVLLAAGADPSRRTQARAETGSFMRDVRTCGETPLHRAAAFGTPAAIDLLLGAGADRETRDVNGDTPLTWASRALRSSEVLRRLCFGPHVVREGREELDVSLIGRPVRWG